MKRVVLLVCVLAVVCLMWPNSARLQNRRPNNRPNPAQPPAQPNAIEPLLKTAARQLQNKNFNQAYQSARRALELSQQLGDKARQARATNLIALAAFHTGRMNESIRMFKLASLSADEAGIANLQTNALTRAGGLLMQSGRYADALFCFQQILQVYRQRKDQAGEARALAQIGGVFAETGDFALASQHLQQALALVRTTDDQETQFAVLRRLVAAEKARGNFQTALDYGQQALGLMSKAPRIFSHAELLYQLATVHSALNQMPKATELFEQALGIIQPMQVPQPEAFVLGEYAATQLKTGNAVAAQQTAAKAATLLKKTGGNKHLEARVQATLAEAQLKLGQTQNALASYRTALAALEDARALSIPTEISRAGIVASRQQVFAGAISLLLSQSLDEEAFAVAESYHARAFLDVLAETGLEADAEMTTAQQEREDQLFEQISAIQRELWQTDVSAEQEAKLKTRLAEAENAMQLFRLELRRADPRYAGVKAPPPIGFNRAAELLEKETALIEFVLGEERSFGWVLKSGKLAAVNLPARKDLEPLIAAFRVTASAKVNSTNAAQAIAKLKAQSQPLYEKLFQPLERHLVGARQLIIVPDGALAYLPFETLAGSANRGALTFLIERFAISYAPSASALDALRKLKPNSTEAKGFIAFGDPVYANSEIETAAPTPAPSQERGFDFRQLPYTRTEVNSIAALFPPTERMVLLGAEAQEEHVKTAPLGKFRYLHFATHALVDEEYPARSAIILSAPTNTRTEVKEDGALQMAEVMRLKLNADLVTLSACRTGLGRMLHGEGIIGLTRAFLYAGADSVVVSLWNVNDIATASLMKAFYKNLKLGLSKDDALRQAKLELLRGRQQAWRHPYFWAPFVLVGDAK